MFMINQKSPSVTIENIVNSKINKVDFTNLKFGHVFTDYMFECDYIDESWVNPIIKPFGNLIHLSCFQSFSLWSSSF